MTLVFGSFAVAAGVVSLLFPHIAGGLGENMMLFYLALAIITALSRLLKK